MGTKRVVVVGGDAAGMSSASQARRMQGPESLEIVAFERGPRTSYAACGLPYFVEGIIEPAERLVARTPEQFAKRDIEVHTGHEVTGIDTTARTVTVADLAKGTERTESYDELIIGTGALGIKPPLPGIDSNGVVQLRTVDDGIDLDSRIRNGARTAAVVGAGYIGVEVTEALLARGLDVTVIQLDETPMAESLDADMATQIADAMRDAGAEVIMGAGAEAFETDGAKLVAVVADGRSIPADVAVLGLGVRANSQLAGEAGVPVGAAGGILVDERMHTQLDGVWAAGDCVESRHRVTGESVVMALGTHANKQGRVLGTNLGGGRSAFPGVIGTAVTKFRDLEIGRTGITEATAHRLGWDVQASTATSKTRAGYYPGAEPVTVKLTVDRSDGRILGAQVLGGPGAGKRIDALAVAVWCEMTVEDLAMADLSYAPPVSPVWDPVVFAAGVAAATFAADRPNVAGKPLQLEFVTSAPSVHEVPEAISDVAVVGRSNVGKSSLINALANRKQLAAVSGTPGRTRLLNAFRLAEGPEPRPLLVDLPGYGYAKVPKAVKDTWGPMIEEYLTGREQLAMVLVLLDGEVGPTRSDLDLLGWLRHEVLPHTVVATKHDKVKPSKREKRRKELASRCDLEPRDVLWVSATKGVNVELLRERVRGWLLH